MQDQTKPLEGQTALVTGSSSGIGAEIARKMAQAGAAVGVNYLGHREAAEEIVKDIVAKGGRAVALDADVSREDAVAKLFTEFNGEFGRLDILVANAGMQRDAPFAEMTLDQWQAVLDVNLTGYFLSAREAVRQFTKQGVDPNRSRAAGKIVFISSVHEMIPWAGHVNYAVSKGGIMQLTKSLAQELAPQRIRVNAIAPGAIRTHINRQAWETPEAMEKLLKLVPYNRIGEPEDIGEAVVWLASEAADYIVGTTLFVDGGMALYPGFRDGG